MALPVTLPVPAETSVHGEPPQRAARTNLFLAAQMIVDARPFDARIRNLSASGAMIEAGVVPPPGRKLTLRRGTLAIDALVRWSSAGRCGLNFDGSVDVREWMAPLGQPKVATIFPSLAPVPPEPVVDPDLALAADLVDLVAVALAGAPDPAAGHHREFQALDLAVQLVRSAGRKIGGGTHECDALRITARAALRLLDPAAAR